MENPIRMRPHFQDRAAQNANSTAANEAATIRMVIDGLRDLPPKKALSLFCDYASTLSVAELPELEKARAFFCDLAWERGRE